MRYFLEIAYDGSEFHGWQLQKNAISVQEVLNQALSTILSAKIETMGCGRTDTGVHATQFFVHFDSEIASANKFLHQLNSLLPSSIAAKNLYQAKDDAHTRFDAKSRTYEYHIITVKNPFRLNYSFRYVAPLDMDLMNRAAERFLSMQEFDSFCKVGSDAKTTICDVSYAKWELEGEGLMFRIKADRFLRNMVRAIVGTLLDVGSGKISLKEFDEILAKKDRSEAGRSVPARGLFLTTVEYPSEIFISKK